MVAFSEWFWGPSYGPAISTDVTSGAIAMLQIWTHISMLLATCFAWNYRHARLAALSGVCLVVSAIFYHPCRSGLYCAFGLTVDQWRVCDHTSVQANVGALLLHLMQLVLAWEDAQFFFAFAGYLIYPIAFISVQIAPFGLLESVPMIIFAVIILCVRIGLMAAHPDTDKSLSHHWATSKRTRFFLEERSGFLYGLAVVLILVGLGCFFITSGGSDGVPTVAEAVTHAIWHLIIGFAELALIVATSDIVTAKVRYAEHRRSKERM